MNNIEGGTLMDKLEKAERLRERANVTYEEAMEALNASGDDLLDAMVWLEQHGKVKKPDQASYSTDYSQQMQYIDVTDRVEQQKRSAPSFQRSLASAFHGIINFVRNTSFKVSRNEKEIFMLPSWLIVIIVLFSWRVTIPAGIIALIFGFRYSFEGPEDTTAANSILSKAGQLAEQMKNDLSNNSKNTESSKNSEDSKTTDNTDTSSNNPA